MMPWARWATRAPTQLVRDRSGVVAVWTAIGMTAMLGAAALAVDISNIRLQQNLLQTAADSAALAAAATLPAGTDADVAAIEYAGHNLPAARYGTVLAEEDVVLGRWNQADRTFTAGETPTNAVWVTLRRSDAAGNPVETYFGRALGVDGVDIASSATAVKVPHSCLLALEPTGPGITLDSNAQIDASTCGIHVNSDDPEALKTDSNASVSAEDICVVGGYEGPADSFSPTPKVGCPSKPDPLAHIAPPTFSGCDANNVSFDDVTATLSPGVYCGGIHLDGSANVTLDPGTYVIKDGPLWTDSNSVLQGTGVTIYLTGDDSTVIYFDSNSEVELSAPTSGPLAGIVIFEDRDTPDMRTHELDSNATMRLEGVVYMPNAQIHIDSNGFAGPASPFTSLVARRFMLDSNGVLNLDADFANSNVPVPKGIANGTALVQ